jgi:azurin
MNLIPLACVITALAFGQATTSTSTTTASKQAKAAPKAAAAKGARTVEISSNDQMKFDKTEIAAKVGETLRIVLKNVGTMPKLVAGHNFVLLKIGTDQVEFTKAAFNARDTEFIPATMKTAVVANTALAGPGETVEVTFKVPAKAGSYPYVCSFPGHFALGMKGTLVAK